MEEQQSTLVVAQKDAETQNELSTSIEVQNMLFRIADEMFSRRKTLLEIINLRVFDYVIDGKEYQLINRGKLNKIH